MFDDKKSRRSLGFTMVELMLVIIILGIMGVVVIPGLRGGDSLQVDTAARMVGAAIGRAQSEAIRSAMPVEVAFTNGQSQFTIVQMLNGGGTQTLETVDISQTGNMVLGTSGSITFYGDGSVFMSGTAGGVSVTMTDGSVNKVVSVNPVTGETSVN